jgi:glutathione S-transferase
MALRWTRKNAPDTVSQIAAGVPALFRPMVRVVLPRQLGRMPRAQGLGRLPDAVLVRELGHRLDDLVTLLGRSRFFYDSAPSAADLAIYGQFSMMRSGPTPEAERLLDERPALADFMKRVREATGG